MRKAIVILLCLLPTYAFGSDRNDNSLANAAEHAVQQSKLTLPGNRPFHLKAEIVETTNPESDYHAAVEEYWVSPYKYRRTINSPEFSQTLLVNGDSVYEKNVGDYFPFWLNELVTALVDPLPMLSAVKQVNTQLSRGPSSAGSRACADLRAHVDRWVICFEGSHGLLESVFTKGYAAECNAPPIKY